LRQFTQQRPKGELEPPRFFSDVLHDTEKASRHREKLAEQQEAWRQREEDERGIEKARAKQVRLAQLQEKEKRKAEHAQRVHEKAVRESARWKAQFEEEERVRVEKEEIKYREERERARRQREAAEAERNRRMPWECTNCQGTGKCLTCQGKGYHMGVFLVSKLNMDTAEHPLEFGRKTQGCETCGGFIPGIRGQVEVGTGVCTVCHGHGLIWPKLEENKPRLDDKRRSRRSIRADSFSIAAATEAQGVPGSPTSPTSPQSASSQLGETSPR